MPFILFIISMIFILGEVELQSATYEFKLSFQNPPILCIIYKMSFLGPVIIEFPESKIALQPDRHNSGKPLKLTLLNKNAK